MNRKEILVFENKLRSNVKTVKYGDQNFLSDDSGFVHVYVDGAIESGYLRVGYGVWWDNNHPRNVVNGVGFNLNSVSPTFGRIKASTEAITIALEHGIPKLRIFANDSFLIKSVTEIANWRQNNWRMADGKPVFETIDLERFEGALDRFDRSNIDFRLTPQNNGIPGREGANQLAIQGIEIAKKNGLGNFHMKLVKHPNDK